MYIVERENMLTGKASFRFFVNWEEAEKYLNRVFESADRVMRDRQIGNIRYIDLVDVSGIISLIVRPADMPA